ncbi:hypothetical protein [Burkholderia ubonensis]|uniref:hypothetical protein n=1 Tax=Burkholderia ubonensis TaxID=101571 RepID=UPI0012F72668|nr:hypothetical protein [Burkholderia ubonensis]
MEHWEAALVSLELLYKNAQRASLSLPSFSLAPAFVFAWATIKFEIFILLDVLFLLPINTVILLRNILPGRWKYRSFSGRYWRYILTWLWRGEAPAAPTGVIRPLVGFMVTAHAHSRFRLLQQRIYLDDTLPESHRVELSKKITSLLDYWKRPSAPQVLYNYLLPLSGPLTGFYGHLFPSDVPQWVFLLEIIFLSYGIAFPITAFMCKRSLMLGGIGESLCFPGEIAGNSGYATEHEIMGRLGIQTREFPFDVTFVCVNLIFAFLMTGQMTIAMYSAMSSMMPPEFGTSELSRQMHSTRLSETISTVVFVGLAILAVCRRRATGRC